MRNRHRSINLLNCLLVLTLLLGVTAHGDVARAQSTAQPTIVINKAFEFIEQGTVGVLRLSGAEVVGATAQVFNRTYPFFTTQQGFASLIAVEVKTAIREHPITVTIQLRDGSTLAWNDTIKVASGGFIAESTFTLPKDRMFLLNPDVQTNEDIRLLSAFGMLTPERYWDSAFTYPVNGRIGSPFGSVRTYSDGQVRRHTGVDFSAPVGTPVLAVSNGRVAFARNLDIHGNHVIIDHGWGIFSAYSHFSAFLVVPGQFVLQGDALGVSGNTGRSSGPHVHFEISVNGVWVDPVRFLRVKLPA